MQKRDVVNLIRYHMDRDEPGFRYQAVEIAKAFDRSGDTELAEYVMDLICDVNSIVPQAISETESFLMPISPLDAEKTGLRLPDAIIRDVEGVVHAMRNGVGVNRFLFYGSPGTGKTEAARLVAGMLHRELYLVATSQLVDSLLGRTPKNVDDLFRQINGARHPERMVVLFDELDAVAMRRVDSRDVREMGRATTAVLRGLDGLDPSVLLIATTNLQERLDKALLRRFDYSVDFDRYGRGDLVEAGFAIFEAQRGNFPQVRPSKRILSKILGLMPSIPYPGDMVNMIRTAMAFAVPDDPYDYLRRLYRSATGTDPDDPIRLSSEGFTLRESELLSGVPKSTVARMVRAMRTPSATCDISSR